VTESVKKSNKQDTPEKYSSPILCTEKNKDLWPLPGQLSLLEDREIWQKRE